MTYRPPIGLREFGEALRQRAAKVGRPETEAEWEEHVLGALHAFGPAPRALQYPRGKDMTWPDLGKPGRALERLEAADIVSSGTWGGVKTWVVLTPYP